MRLQYAILFPIFVSLIIQSCGPDEPDLAPSKESIATAPKEQNGDDVKDKTEEQRSDEHDVPPAEQAPPAAPGDPTAALPSDINPFYPQPGLDAPPLPWGGYPIGGSGGGGGGRRTERFSVGGSITGLTAPGLVLQNSGGDDLAILANATNFEFAAQLESGDSYSVTIATQPTGLTCSVSSGTGSVDNADISDVLITCAADTVTIGGTVSGLTAAGLILRNNGGDDLPLAIGATSFTFSTALASGSPYNVTVFSQPAGLTCSLTNQAGNALADVTNVAVTCVPAIAETFSIGGSISGLSGTGLVLVNGSETLPVLSGSTSFAFLNELPANASYAVTVQSSPEGLSCTVSNGGGTVVNADVTNVAVVCLPSGFVIGGTVSGLTVDGLILLNNGVDSITLNNGDTTFAFPDLVIPAGAYNVTVQTSPIGLTCVVTSGAMGVASSNVNNVVVACTPTLP